VKSGIEEEDTCEKGKTVRQLNYPEGREKRRKQDESEMPFPSKGRGGLPPWEKRKTFSRGERKGVRHGEKRMKKLGEGRGDSCSEWEKKELWKKVGEKTFLGTGENSVSQS